MQILVLGAGVIGLTSAIELQEAGHDVTVRAPERTPGTTSDVAAAVHYPFMAEPRDKVLAWSKVSLDVFREQADEPGTGVRIDDLLEVFDDPPPEPWWGEAVISIRQASQAELPHGYGGGLISTVPFIDMATYMPYLEDRFDAAGGSFEQGAVGSLDELAGQGWEVVVNATGMGARELVGDDRLTPVRGQVVHVEAPDFGKGIVDQQRDAQLATWCPWRTGSCSAGRPRRARPTARRASTPPMSSWPGAAGSPRTWRVARSLRSRWGCDRSATRCDSSTRCWTRGSWWCTTTATGAQA